MGEAAKGNWQEISDCFDQDFSRKDAKTPRKEKIRSTKSEIRDKSKMIEIQKSQTGPIRVRFANFFHF
jgi:hypothetical protein